MKVIKLKYIRYNVHSFLIFTKDLNHAMMAEKLDIKKKDINSAGFINAIDMKFYGESESLNVKSDPEDQDVFHVFHSEDM